MLLPDKMKAAEWSDYNIVRIIEKELPKPKKREVLIKIMATGLCATDLHVVKGLFNNGNPPQILGHEIAGEVIALGEDTNTYWLNKRVVVETSIGCGFCENCRNGQRHMCADSTDIGFEPNQGGYAQFITVPEENLFKLPDNVSYEEGGIIESVVCPVGALYRLSVEFSETVAVYGIGPAGIAFIQGAKAMGAKTVIAIGRNDEKLEEAKKFGADFVINNKKENVLDRINELTGSKGVDTVCEAAGAISTISESFEIVKRGGRVILYGIPGDTDKMDFPITKIIVKQISVHGAVGNPNVWKPLLDAVSSGKINLRDMITLRMPLDDISKAFELLENRNQNIIKIVLLPWEEKTV